MSSLDLRFMDGLRNEQSNSPFVSVIVPTFRRTNVLAETLEALINLDYPQDKYEIIVIDDGSGDHTPDIVASLQRTLPRLTYYSQSNSGVATARNHGARIAQGEVLIFVDDDIIVPSSMIRHHLATMAEFGDCLVNGHWEFAPQLTATLQETPFGRFRLETEEWVKKGLEKFLIKDCYYEPAGVTACNLGICREHFWQIKGFDEQFPHAGFEDQEFSLRAKRSGFRFIYDFELKLWHNDHRLTLKQFCDRQRRGAITAALMAVKHPEERANSPLIIENCKIQVTDSVTLILKKVVKSILATKIGIFLFHWLIRLVELLLPRTLLLSKLYWMAYGLSIFQGIREGLVRYNNGDRPVTMIINLVKS